MIIGISGKIGSGKDTIADMIMDAFPQFEKRRWADKLKDMVCLIIGCNRGQLEDPEFKNTPLSEEWTKYSITDNGKSTKIGSSPTHKEALLFLKNNPNNSYHKYEIVKQEMTPRLMLQQIGTEGGRELIHPNIWVNSLMADYQHIFREVRRELIYEWEERKNVVEVTWTYPNWVIPDTRFPNEAKAVQDKDGILIRVERGHGDTGNHLSETALDNWQVWDLVFSNHGPIQDLEDQVHKYLIPKIKKKLKNG